MSVRSARNEPFASILQRRWSRREFLATAGVSVAGLAVAAPAQMPAPVAGLEVTDELRWQRLLSLGDALWPRVPALLPADLRTMSWLNRDAVRRQARQFGDCCDAIAYFPQRPDDPDRGLLCVNHEYVDLQLVFAGFMPSADWFRRHPLSVPWMQAAHGVSVVAIERRDGQWHLQQGHALTRRITATTPCEIRGPARGHELLRSRADPRGVRAVGTFSNCSGGKTPWGTFLTAEENIQDNFGFAESWQRAGAPVDTAAAHERWPLKQESLYGWEHVDPRFDLRQDAREPLRHGWIVEIDPQDPRRPPIKRTALGRFCHESANTVLTADGRVAVYMGDDTKFEYVYKFVTRQRFDAASREANAHLLDDGQLFVARFDANGRGVWMPLVHDEKGPLNSRAGFRSQGDVVLKCRAAADLLGATPMDRPEDFQPNPVNGRVYLACTKNADRQATGSVRRATDAANPRPQNDYGHIIEMTPADGDHAATAFEWNVFMLAGDPARGRFLVRYEDVMRVPLAREDSYFAGYADAARISPIACPDNVAFDRRGNLWIATDAEMDQIPNNGCYRVPVDGPHRGLLERKVVAPAGAEVCGVEFTPDGSTLFLSMQHPGEGGTVAAPICDWPDGHGLPPRSTLVAIARKDGQAF